MASVEADREFVSPVRKLSRLFLKSRNRWKTKCQDAKYALKLAKNQIRAVERSRDHWKEQAAERQRRIAELEAELKKTPAR
jgi:hypothetical protein